MHRFSVDTKVRVMEKIRSCAPRGCDADVGEGSYQRMLQKLRADGFGLIDLQAMEATSSTVWYCKRKSMFGWIESESVAMLVWEGEDCAQQDGSMTVIQWRL